VVEVSRNLAAFHLDRMASTGLLTVEYRRLTGRSGRGAGRPAKLYREDGGIELRNCPFTSWPPPTASSPAR
jgi:predicted ArsR family transcriptional regulator